eukprot:6211223-Pleurochrysis_carterae.AAC.1
MLGMQLLQCARRSLVGTAVNATFCGGAVNVLRKSLLQHVACTSIRALSSSWDPKVLNELRASEGENKASDAGRDAGRARNVS